MEQFQIILNRQHLLLLLVNMRDGSFHAKDILTKCPSKYEEKFDESSKS